MTEVDEFATAHQRGIASAVQALGLIAQRVAAAGVMGGDGPSMLEEQVCGLLLPLTMETEPVEQLPPGAVKPAQAAYWVTEGAAFALLMLCGGGPAAAAAAGGNSVTPTMPAHHSDPRYAYGMCILALRRAEAGGAPCKRTGLSRPSLPPPEKQLASRVHSPSRSSPIPPSGRL